MWLLYGSHIVIRKKVYISKKMTKNALPTCVSAILTTSEYHDLRMYIVISIKGIGTFTDAEGN